MRKLELESLRLPLRVGGAAQYDSEGKRQLEGWAQYSGSVPLADRLELTKLVTNDAY